MLREICEKVNALGVAHRTVAQIKTKGSNIVSDGKAKDAEIKRSHGKTRGGPPCAPATATQDKIINLIAETPSLLLQQQQNLGRIFGTSIMHLSPPRSRGLGCCSF